MTQVTVEDLFKANQSKLQLELLAGEEGLKNFIQKPRIQKSSLALAGYTVHIDSSKIQFLGETEISFLISLSPEEREKRLNQFSESMVPCFFVTKGLGVPEELVRVCNHKKIPILRSPLFSSHCIKRITSYLEEALAHRITRSGVLVDVYGVGILILGKSGIGKSECALDLIDRGHRLVADDTVMIKKKDMETLVGGSSDMTSHHMEIRGLGIINIKDLYGVSSIQQEKEIDLVVELVEWKASESFDRLGLEERSFEIMEVMKPFLRMPVTPGRNMALIMEVAARNYLLKSSGHFSARLFDNKLKKKIQSHYEETDT